jgi:Ca-activated chloride channel family protein
VGDLQKAEELVAFAGKHAGPSARIFVFGVGYDVNTHLLDKMALQNRGDRIYVSPEENIEVKVSSFYDKIAYPVLSDIAVEIPGADTYDRFPPGLPDLFRGSQVVLYGRYRNAGHSAVRLTGKVRGKTTEHVYEVNFPERSDAHTHIPRLWATMKIGFLLDQLRLKGIDVAKGQKPAGKDKELMDEIVALASEFGVVTPYTAMLVLEDARGPGGPATPAARRLREARDEDEAVAESVDHAIRSLGYTSGEGAVGASKAASDLKKGKSPGRKDAFSRAMKSEETFKQVLDRTFVLVSGVWCDSRIDLEAETRKVVFLSDAYFALIKAHPKLARYLSVGERVKVVLDGQVYEITS